MDRVQQRLDLVFIPLDNFCEPYNTKSQSPTEFHHNWKSSNETISQIQV